ncbi:MAG: sigma 54-interacting transcriptional regulator [Sphingopyxis sp.]|nr:sigma 54-interacting transcriptional regulator [Sphingopyxis sp.]
MNFAVSQSGPVSQSALEEMLASPAFTTIANLLATGLVVISPDEAIVHINVAAGRYLGVEPQDVFKRPLTTLLQNSRILPSDWTAFVQKGRSEKSFVGAEGEPQFHVTRRVIPARGARSGYTVFVLSPPGQGTADQGTAEQAQTRGALILPPNLRARIDRAVTAHRRGLRVLLLGESGVGKTSIAKYIHQASSGADKPFIHVNCGSIPETLMESEMFGYERGAFTGALSSGKTGFVESAEGGTLFLDEVGEIPITSQAKILKFLEDSTIQPIGSAKSRKIRTTVIAATNRNLSEMIAERTFRRDLYFRIATFPVTIPPLRDRDDRNILLDAFLTNANENRDRPLGLTEACRSAILNAPLPGNLREMQSIVQYLDIVCDTLADASDLADEAILGKGTPSATSVAEDGVGGLLRDQVRAIEARIIQAAIDKHGSKKDAAASLGIDVTTLLRKLAREADEAR